MHGKKKRRNIVSGLLKSKFHLFWIFSVCKILTRVSRVSPARILGKFLLFVTGSDVVPCGALKYVTPKIDITLMLDLVALVFLFQVLVFKIEQFQIIPKKFSKKTFPFRSPFRYGHPPTPPYGLSKGFQWDQCNEQMPLTWDNTQHAQQCMNSSSLSSKL